MKAFVELPDDATAWRLLPRTTVGGEGPLPNWARALAPHLPRTAAAMLQLDAVHRTKGLGNPILRAKLRWVVARENRCGYAMETAIADLRRAGASDESISRLVAGPDGWSEADRDAFELVRALTIDAPSLPDDLFERVRRRFGDRTVARIVLLAAYGNFQDRWLLGLGLPLEADGPLPPIVVEFVDGTLQLEPHTPSPARRIRLAAAIGDGREKRTGRFAEAFRELQRRLERQRGLPPRLPVPRWQEVVEQLPAAMASRPTRIVWNLMTFGYAADLQIPWTIATRTHWAERPEDRILEELLFWIQTHTVGCHYCMGHCEMLLELSGLGSDEIGELLSQLAIDDWTGFDPADRRAFGLARKLTGSPWELSSEDFGTLATDYGLTDAMSLFWWLCRGLYMTRISDGFRLPLERENVFA